MNLDERFADLVAEFRRAVNDEIVRARRETIEAMARCLAQMRLAANEHDWKKAASDAAAHFENDPAAMELVNTLAAMTVPVLPRAVPLEEKELRARRFAKVRVAEIQLYHATAVSEGRTAGDLYGRLQPQMDAAREAYREKFLTPINGSADYLHVEFLRTLANDDAAMLGPGYPGPLA